MFSLHIFSILYVFICGCFALNLYEQSTLIAQHQRNKNENLYSSHNSTPENYEFAFQNEGFNISASNRRADILLEYQRLLKNSNKCKAKTYTDCLHASKKYVSIVDRCLLPDGVCSSKERYRRINGLCNNLKHPNIGIPYIPYAQMLDAVYEDDISELRKAANGQELPNPRVISNLIDKAEDFNSQSNTITLASVHLMFSQMIAHDTTRRSGSEIKGNNANGIECCEDSYSGPLPANETNPGCIGVPLPKNDQFYANKGVFCQTVIRMTPTLRINCNIKYAPENTVSSFLDLGNIYSDSLADLDRMRLHSGGLFKMDSQNHLPFDFNGFPVTGDQFFVQHTALIAMHVIFYRFHNMIATYLGKHNPHWTDNHTFYEARRIVIAVWQHLIYSEWLPLVLGEKRMRAHKLKCQGKCDKYDPNIDPTTTIDYAIAFRWFHTNIPENIWLVDQTGETITEVLFSDTYLSFGLITTTNYTNLIRGLMKQPQRMFRVGYTDEFRNLFFKAKFRGQEVGIDGLLLDIMRTRDGGVAPYIDFYPMCLNKKIESWSDLEPFFEKSHFKLLRQLYKNIRDIDLMVGILMEKRNKNQNMLTKIGGCIVAKQFFNFKYGDRFFYSHHNNPNRFSKDFIQFHAIKQMTFSKLVCMTVDVGIVPKYKFASVTAENPFIKCSTLEPFDLAPFK